MSSISELWRIIKKWAKTGKLDSDDALRGLVMVGDIVDQASEYNHKGELKRKNFSKITQEIILIKQANRCNICKEKLDDELFDFDHVDGNRSNNSISNCQALCPNCHRKKSRMRKKLN